MTLTAEIKAYALQLGFCKIGITTAQKLGRVQAEARSRGGYDFWLHVAWALGQMRDETALDALREHQKAESSPAVLEEIALVLQEVSA